MANNSSLQVFATVTQGQAINGSLIQIMNDEMVQMLIPVVVYMSLVMILGLFGNAFVCYYYTFKEKKSTNTFFIVVLSVYDFLTCCITVPTEIAIIALYYTFVDDLACKTLRFINIFLLTASILTLIAIATDRFKRICRVGRPQMDIPQARRVSVIIVLLSIILALPTLFIYGAKRLSIANKSTLDHHGLTCRKTKEVEHRVYIVAYTATQFFVLVVSLAVLIILYIIIGQTIYHHRKRLQSQLKGNHKGIEFKYVETKCATSSSFTTEDGQTKEEAIRSDAPVDQIVSNGDGEQSEPYMSSNGNTDTTSNQLTAVIDGTNKVDPNNKGHEVQCNAKPSIVKDARRNHQFDAETVRVTIVMVIVTVVFIVSFIPYISLAVWERITGRDESVFLSDTSLVAYKIGFRSYLLNSSLNPWIYGIFNSQFRRFYFGWCFRERD